MKPFYSAETNSGKTESLSKTVKAVAEPITQREIDDVNARHLDILKDVRRTIKKMVELGRLLDEYKNRRLRHGQWAPWVDRNLQFSIRTANRYMKVYYHRDDPALSENPEGFLSQVYGNESKALPDKSDVGTKPDVDVGFEGDKQDGDNEDDDSEQSGGEGPNFGGEQNVPDTDSRRALEHGFAQQGEPGPYYFRLVVRVFEEKFFSRKTANTLQTKLDFIIELIKWLEEKKKNLNA